MGIFNPTPTLSPTIHVLIVYSILFWRLLFFPPTFPWNPTFVLPICLSSVTLASPPTCNWLRCFRRPWYPPHHLAVCLQSHSFTRNSPFQLYTPTLGRWIEKAKCVTIIHSPLKVHVLLLLGADYVMIPQLRRLSLHLKNTKFLAVVMHVFKWHSFTPAPPLLLMLPYITTHLII